MVSSSEVRKLSPNKHINSLLAEIDDSAFDAFDVARDHSTLTTEEEESIFDETDIIREPDYEELTEEIRDLTRKRGYDSGAD